MDSKQELFLCQAIETGLSAAFSQDDGLTDGLCILALENAIVAIKQQFGFAKNETVHRHPTTDAVIDHVVGVGIATIGQVDGLTLKDYVAVVTKIKKSVIRHSALGPLAYFNFIKNYV